ncbi:MAG: hypothetical protein M3Y20_07355 [Actinomycetota bacterium]|nr:hypothetical protein [Actinomycetota bacterium]
MAPRDLVRARRAIAATGALLLLFAGLPGAAHAAQGDTISGSVVLADGISTTSTRVVAHAYSESLGRWVSEDYSWLEDDGTFEIDWLEPGVDYRLFLDTWSSTLPPGFYGGPGVLVAEPEGAASVFAGARDVVITPQGGVLLHGTVVFEPGVLVPPSVQLTAYSGRPDQDHSYVYRSVNVTTGGTGLDFAIPGLFPGATYVIGIRASTSSATRAVYYSVEGLVADRAFATAVTPESEVHITVGPKLVEPTITAVVAPTVSGRGAVGETLSATPGTWSIEDATVSYLWLRDGHVIPGANAATYVISRADRGTAITVRVTASKDGFTAGVATLSAARVPTDPAARATTKPKVSGSARLGSTLRASAGAWDLPGVVAEYQWLRGSKAIKGATSARYTLTTADVGKRVSVRVTGKVAGHADGVASSSSKKVAKGKPRVTAKASSVKVGKRAKVVVRVKASGLSRPKGTVTVKYGTRTVKVKLAAKRKGKVTVRLPQLAKGRYAIKVSFKPSGASAKYVTKASAKKTTLRVR